MEQNLSERERRVRLGIGMVFAVATIASLLDSRSIYITISLALLAAGFITNYFSCFCGIKELLSKTKK